MGSDVKGKLINRSGFYVWALQSIENEGNFHWDAYVLAPGFQSPDDVDVDAVKALDDDLVIYNDMGVADSNSSKAKPWWQFGSWPLSKTPAKATLTDVRTTNPSKVRIVIVDGACKNKAEKDFSDLGPINYKQSNWGRPNPK
jgi:hypothetical protein